MKQYSIKTVDGERIEYITERPIKFRDIFESPGCLELSFTDGTKRYIAIHHIVSVTETKIEN